MCFFGVFFRHLCHRYLPARAMMATPCSSASVGSWLGCPSHPGLAERRRSTLAEESELFSVVGKKTLLGLDGRNKARQKWGYPATSTLKICVAVPLTRCGQLCYLPLGCSTQTEAPGCWREQIRSGRSCSDTSTSALTTRLPRVDKRLAYRRKAAKSVGALLATYLQGFPLQHWQLTAVSRHKVIAAAVQPFTLWRQTVSVSKTQKRYVRALTVRVTFAD